MRLRPLTLPAPPPVPRPWLRTGLLAVLLLALAGCGTSDLHDTKSTADQLFKKGRKAMDGGNYKNAIAYYEALSARFPFSNQTKQAQLDIIYAYYMNGESESAVDSATQFERENPTHPRVDYAIYMRGLANFHGQRNWFYRMMHVDLSKRPPDKAKESFSAFSQLLQRYPQSVYAPDARQRMIFLRNELADYENHIAQFYMERGAWMAALNRARYALETYDGAPAVADSLAIMAECYTRLGMTELAATTHQVLEDSYPDSPAARSRSVGRPWYQFW